MAKTSPLNFRALFESSPALYLVLSPDPSLVIQAVTDAYAQATLTRREDILGKELFEVFPDNPNDPKADGVNNLRASLLRVLESRTADRMPIQKYDIRRPEAAGGGFEERFWSPLNTPIFAAGKMIAIIHQVEDVTAAVYSARMLRKSQEFLDSMLENLPSMVFVKDAKDLRFVKFNRAGEELLGHKRGDLIGKSDYEIFPKKEAEFFISKDREVLAGTSIIDIPEEVIDTKLKGRRILHTRKIPLFDSDGKPEYLLGISDDITEAKRAETVRLRLIREQTSLEARERAGRWTTFLSEASTMLASSLDYRTTIGKLASLAVPTLADWCTVTVVQANGKRERIAAVHKDPQKSGLIHELNRYPPGIQRNDSIASVLSTGKSILFHEIPAGLLEKEAQDDRHLEIFRELGCASCMLVPIEARGEIHGVIVLVSNDPERRYDVHDLKIAEELARRAAVAIDNATLYEATQKAVRARDEFLSVASHELKTPITSLKLQLQMTRKRTNPGQNLAPTPEKLARVLDIAGIQLERLTILVEDLLDVSRIEAGKLSYHFEATDIVKLVRDMVERYSDNLRNAGCAVSIGGEESIVASVDPSRLERVVLNLLSNAVKYGAGKPIELNVSRSGDNVVITCKDHGIGIPEDKQDVIFKKFERAVSPANISGLGLGLYIAREIVDSHQGRIQIQSQVGQGTTFRVELPLAKAGEIYELRAKTNLNR